MGTDKPFVVVVDDDASVSRAIRRLLRSVGIAADTYTSGDEFLYVLSATPSYRPDCAILDVQMPGANGIEVQRRLAGSTLPVIFITAHDDAGVREASIPARPKAHVRKPFSDVLFIRAVCAVLGIAA